VAINFDGLMFTVLGKGSLY
jgi:hypothetical protein